MRTLFTLCLLLAGFFSFAQQYKISFSGQSEFSVDDPKVRVADGFIQYEKTDNKMQFGYTAKLYKVRFGIKLTKYDNEMKMVKELALQNGDRAYGPFDIKVQYVGNKLYLFYFQMAGETEEGDINIFAAEINASDLTLGTPMKVLSINQKNGGIFSKAFTSAAYNVFAIMPSPDKSKTLVFWTPNNSDGNYFFSVLNADFSPFTEKRGTMMTLTDPDVKSVCVDNLGDVFIAYAGAVDKHTMEQHIIVCAPKKKEKEVTLSLGESLIGTMCVHASKTNDIVHIGGTYGETLNFTGVYHATISAALPKVSKPIQVPLPDTLLKQLIDEGWGSDKKKRYGLERHYYPLPYELEDGSFGMAAEFREAITTTSTNMNGGLSSSHTNIISGDILNIRFDGNKSIVTSRIPKYRNSNAGRTVGDSYFALPYHNTMLFFYADNEKNLNRSLADQAVSSNVYTNSVMLVAAIDEAGNIKREKLIDKKDDDFLPVADDATYVPGTKELYIPVQKIRKLGGIGKEAMWAKVEIQ